MCGNITMLPAASVAIVHTIAMTVRRSMRSDNLPTGYCVSTAARMLTAMNVATPDVPSPLSRAYTGPIEKMVDEIIPETVTATPPSGEFLYKSRYRTLSGTVVSGEWWEDTTIGTIASEIRTETSMKGIEVLG